MRHRKKYKQLGRTSAHRDAMLSNMAISLIVNKRITTTLTKAKVLKSYVEPLITKSKNDSTHSRRIVFSYLQNKEAVSELFREISTKVATRDGGYTRIMKLGPRQGDNAEMCIIELVDYNETLGITKTTEEETTTKRRRKRKTGTKKSTEETTSVVENTKEDLIEEVDDVVEVVEESVKEEPVSKVESDDIIEEEKKTDDSEDEKEIKKD